MFSNVNYPAIRIGTQNFDEQITLAKNAGFGGLDIPVGLTDIGDDPEATRSKLRDAGLRPGQAQLPLKFRGSEQELNDSLGELTRLTDVAQRVGCNCTATWIMPCDDDLDYRANFDRHVAHLTPIVKILKDHGLRIALEFVGPKTLRQTKRYEFIHTIDGILELCDAIDPRTCGVLLDSFHWYTSKASADDISTKLRGRIVYVHVNDARQGRGPDEQIDSERDLPLATGVIDARTFMQATGAAGYDGPVTAEPFIKAFANQAAADVAKKVADSVNRMVKLAE